jgi:alkylation response protein AidB-like acyl-CoA dehydrogenase
MDESVNQRLMIREQVARFVRCEMIPLESGYLRRLVEGVRPALDPAHVDRLRSISRDMGLWGLDAPTEMGGLDLPTADMAVIVEELARSCIPFQLPPDSPNLRMLLAVGSEEQKEKYLKPYVEGAVTSAIAISEPGAGGDPSAMATHAVLTDDGWVLNGRKIWISNASTADFVIAMARVGGEEGRAGITAFIVERGTPGFIVEREIAMLGDWLTYEVMFENCVIPVGNLLGAVGQGYEPMQLRLRTRRIEMGSTAIGMAQRALEVLCEHANQRVTFGVRLAERQAIQWWVADISTRLHAARLMVQDVAAKADRGEPVSQEASMVKVYATELAYDAVDYAMQTLGALGATQETVLHPFWQRARLMRIYEGPSEVHRQAIARRVLSEFA